MGRKKRLEDEELLAIARDAFVKEGFGASTRAIARQAGVSETVLFQRFRTKPELFFTAMVPPAPDLHTILARHPAPGEPSIQLEQIGLRMLAYFRDVTPILLPLMSHPEFSYDTFVERNPDFPLNQLVVGLQAWLSRLEEEEVVVPGGADAMALTMVSSMASLALFERIGVHGGEVAEHLVREMARLIWRGGATAKRG